MRRLALVLLAVLVGLAPRIASAQAFFGRVNAESACGTHLDIHLGDGELYATERGSGAQEWAMDVSAKGATGYFGLLPGGDVLGSLWQVGFGTIDGSTTSADTAFVALTFPDNGLYLDSMGLDPFRQFADVRIQRVGDSPPTGTLPAAGDARLPGDASPYVVTMASGPRAYPHATSRSIEVAFAPLVEVTATDVGGCRFGSPYADPLTGRGLVRGYNVYRTPGDPSLPPTPAELGQPANWVYFVDLDGFAFGIANAIDAVAEDVDCDGRAEPDTGPNDLRPEDLAALHDPDGVPYSGDEVLVFADMPTHRDGSPRPWGSPPAPDGAQGNWYAVQPVSRGRIDDFAAFRWGGDVRVDLTGDGVPDAVDVDAVSGNGPEFLSPQADFGLGGLGLAHDGLPLLSRMTWGITSTAAFPCASAPPSPVDDLVVVPMSSGGGGLSFSWSPVTRRADGTVLDFASYELHRGARPDFLLGGPSLAWSGEGPGASLPTRPARLECFLVVTVDAQGNRSPGE